MASITPEVFRVTNYGGYLSFAASGGEGVEYYAVVGIGPDEFDKATTLGLPKEGNPHVNPDLTRLGTVQRVSRVKECPPLLWIARVDYSQGGTFNFSTRLGSRLDMMEPEELSVPMFSRIGPNAYGSADRLGWNVIERFRYRRVESRQTTVPLGTVQRILSENIGKCYAFDDIAYRLAGAGAAYDAGNNGRIDTVFETNGTVSGIPLTGPGSVPGVDIAVPQLRPLFKYAVTWGGDNGLVPSVSTLDPEQIYGIGGELPWL